MHKPDSQHPFMSVILSEAKDLLFCIFPDGAPYLPQSADVGLQISIHWGWRAPFLSQRDLGSPTPYPRAVIVGAGWGSFLVLVKSRP